MHNYFKRLRKYYFVLISTWLSSNVILNMISIHINPDRAFHQVFPYQDLCWQLSNFYFYFVANFTYCQFKNIICFASPLLMVACYLYVSTWQDEISSQVHDLLPEHLKFFVVVSLNKTMNRVSGTALAAILAKYHEERQVIELIITRWANRNLHNQLISLYKT